MVMVLMIFVILVMMVMIMAVLRCLIVMAEVMEAGDRRACSGGY